MIIFSENGVLIFTVSLSMSQCIDLVTNVIVGGIVFRNRQKRK